MRNKYVPTVGGLISADDAPIVAREFSVIEKSSGAVTPENVVSHAASNRSALHKYFTWDDSEAAQKCRLQEARLLIRSVSVVVYGKTPSEPIRAFVSVVSKEGESRFDGRAYISTARAMRDEDYRKQVIEDAYCELQSWKRRYEHLKEFANVVRAIEEQPELEAA